jgi:hypothetical protein
VPHISIKRRRRHGVVGVRRLELTERVRRVARLRYLIEPAAGGQGVAETAGGSTRGRMLIPPKFHCISTQIYLHCISYVFLVYSIRIIREKAVFHSRLVLWKYSWNTENTTRHHAINANQYSHLVNTRSEYVHNTLEYVRIRVRDTRPRIR